MEDQSADQGDHSHSSDLSPEEWARLPTVQPGTQLETSGVYFDLDHPDRGPFKALPGQEAGSGNRYVAKRDVDYTVWNRLVEQDVPVPAESAVQPRSAGGSVEAIYERSEAGVGGDR